MKRSIRMSGSVRQSRVGRMRDNLRISNQNSLSKPLSPISRKTIYIDNNNNIVNPDGRSNYSNKFLSKKASNVSGIIFEPPNSRGIWDSESGLHNDTDDNSISNYVNSPQILSNRFNSPKIIPEHGHTFERDMSRTKKVKNRFKSVSPIRG